MNGRGYNCCGGLGMEMADWYNYLCGLWGWGKSCERVGQTVDPTQRFKVFLFIVVC